MEYVALSLTDPPVAGTDGPEALAVGRPPPSSPQDAMPKPSSLTEVLDTIKATAARHPRTPLGDLLDGIGRRSFGPLLILGGVVILAPVIGDIPGVPTAIGVVVFLIAVQIVAGRQSFWLPDWLLDRSVRSSKLEKPVEKLRKPAAFLDNLFKPRLKVLLAEPVIRGIALTCLLVSVVMPALDFIPFSANAGGAVLLCFGLALIVRDGLMVIVGAVVTLLTLALVAMALL